MVYYYRNDNEDMNNLVLYYYFHHDNDVLDYYLDHLCDEDDVMGTNDMEGMEGMEGMDDMEDMEDNYNGDDVTFYNQYSHNFDLNSCHLQAVYYMNRNKMFFYEFYQDMQIHNVDN
jgi:hypothetical protein